MVNFIYEEGDFVRGRGEQKVRYILMRVMDGHSYCRTGKVMPVISELGCVAYFTLHYYSILVMKTVSNKREALS
jgi:hypothetical protein